MCHSGVKYQIEVVIFNTSSFIQTLLSVPETNRFCNLLLLADYTADRELHPALKIYGRKYMFFNFNVQVICCKLLSQITRT